MENYCGERNGIPSGAFILKRLQQRRCNRRGKRQRRHIRQNGRFTERQRSEVLILSKISSNVLSHCHCLEETKQKLSIIFQSLSVLLTNIIRLKRMYFYYNLSLSKAQLGFKPRSFKPRPLGLDIRTKFALLLLFALKR